MRGMRSKAVETKEDFFRTHTFMLRMNGRYSRILPALPTKYKRMTSTGQVQDILHTESANTMRLMVSLAIKCPGGFTGYSDDDDLFHVDGFMFFANLQIKKQEHGLSHDFFAGQQKI